MSRMLKCHPNTVAKWLINFGIDYKGNQGAKGKKISNFYHKADFYLSKNGPFIKPLALKNKLIKDGLRERKCESCGLREWLGFPIPIELHHVDGDNSNNEDNNLKVLCPNCHSQTDNHAGKKKSFMGV